MSGRHRASPDRGSVPFIKGKKSAKAMQIGPEMKSEKFTFIDLFAGIGGFRLALEQAGGRCLFGSEWNKFAQVTYEANFGEVPYGDIRKVDTRQIPDHDILVAGFPCQPFSIAGVTKKNALGRPHGFLDNVQGTLFFDVARIIGAKRPKTFILENVRNLIHHDQGKTFRTILSTLNGLEYAIFWKVVDAKTYVPQHRERIFIVGFDARRYLPFSFTFPKPPAHRLSELDDVLETVPLEKYTLTDHQWDYLKNYAEKHRLKGNGFHYGLVDPSSDRITRTLSARYYKDGSEILIGQDGRNPRRLTPRECARLMGFPDSFSIPVSDTQAYRQFGNAVVPPVVRALVGSVLRAMANGPYIQEAAKPEHVSDPLGQHFLGTEGQEIPQLKGLPVPASLSGKR